MELRATGLVAVLFLCSPALAEDRWAYTRDGKEVILHEDGTWEFGPEPSTPRPDPGSITYFRFTPQDLAVDSQGQVISLVGDGIEVADLEKRRTRYRVFDPKSTVWVVPPFYRSVNVEIAVDADDNPVILWSGKKQDGTYESYVTVFGAEESLQFERALGLVHDFTLGSNGHIFILGHLLGTNYSTRERSEDGRSRILVVGRPDLIHEFSPEGQDIRSFHPWPSDEVRELNRVGEANIVTIGASVFVMHQLLSESIYEYRNGVFVQTHDLEQPEGVSRVLRSMFSVDGKVYVTSMLGRKHSLPEDTSRPTNYAFSVERREIHVIEGSTARLVSSGGPMGKRIGMTPEGKWIAELPNSRILGTSDRPGVFVIENE